MPKSISERGFLVVEDDPQALRLVKMVLEDMDAALIFAVSDGDAAWEAFTRHRDTIDVVITDWNLPGKNGLELLKLIRDSGRQVAVIMLTGRASLESAVEASTSGADYYVFKPFTPDNLRYKVYAAMNDLAKREEE